MSMFRGPNGKISMARVIAFMLALMSAELLVVISLYTLGGRPSAAVLTALGGVMLTLVAHGIVALVRRNTGSTPVALDGRSVDSLPEFPRPTIRS